MQEKLYELFAQEQQKQEIVRVLSYNEKTTRFGVSLTEEDAAMLMVCRSDALREQRRIEFAEGILPKLIEAFCDSQYMEQENYRDTLAELQEIFYLFKNESEDKLTDDELITFMREQFDDICFGSIEYLSETCLERFTRSIRVGYNHFHLSGGSGEYSQFSEEARWDRGLFLEALEELVI